MSASRSSSRSRRPEKSKQALILVLGSVAAIGGFYALSRLGPKSYAVAERRATISKEQADKLRNLAEKAEARWDEIKKKRTQTKTAYSEDDLATIGEAYVARFQYEDQVTGADTHASALKKELHDRMGESLHNRSVALERSGHSEENEKRYAQALELYKSALELETQITNEYPESSYADTQRNVHLTGLTRIMVARPLWESSAADEKEGEAAYARGDIAGAATFIGRAAKSNYTLDREYQGLTKADAVRTRRLERRLSTLNSISVRDHALSLLAKAETAAAAKDFSEVQKLREGVEADVNKLTGDYPESEYSTPEITGDLVRRAQNAAATPDVEAVRRDLATFEESVRKGLPDSARLVENLARAVQRIREAYPQSDLLEKRIDERVGYLFEHRSEVASVRASVSAALRPVPGFAGLSAYRTETDQRLYVLLMSANPSATKDGFRPVESVTRREAEFFCTRLGWMLAREVRLPSEAEFRAIAGKTAASSLAATARGIDNSDGTSTTVPAAKPDANDFCDVLGNVAEWLAPAAPDGSGEGIVAGGNAENTLAQLASVPVQSVPATQRSRLTGFRFVVTTPPAR